MPQAIVPFVALPTALFSSSLLLVLLYLFSLQCLTVVARGGINAATSYDDLFPNDTWIYRGDFPEKFTFGALTWSMKHEGAPNTDGKGVSIWDTYAMQDGTVWDGTSPGEAGDHYNRYSDDIKLLTNMGMDSFRFSIAWPRIFPNGTGEVNEKAVAHYNDVLDRLIEEGIEPHVTLYEQDLPQALQDSYGGLLSPLFIDDFQSYANVCFSAFGDRVKHWVTFEEPNDFVPYSYAGTYCPPGRCSVGLPPFNCTAGNSSTEPYIAAHNLLLAHAAVAEVYRKHYQPTQGGEIGLAVWFKWFEPLSDSSIDLAAAQRGTDFSVGWFLDPVLYGHYPAVMREILGSRLPTFTEEQSASLRQSVDFVGLSAVSALYVTYNDEYKTNTTGYFQDMWIKKTAYKDGVIIGEHEGGEYSVPWCITRILNYMKVHYNNFPVYITSIGRGLDNLPMEETLDDINRVRFYSSYFSSLIEGIRDGANVRGIFVWSLIDGFETLYGLSIRFGLYYVDENLDRYPRLTALWFKEILSNNYTTQSTNKYLQQL